MTCTCYDVHACVDYSYSSVTAISLHISYLYIYSCWIESSRSKKKHHQYQFESIIYYQKEATVCSAPQKSSVVINAFNMLLDGDQSISATGTVPMSSSAELRE